MLPNGKTKILNVMRIKKFFKQPDTSNIENKTVSGSENLDLNSKSEFTGPVTRAMKKLLEQQNATNLAISVLCDLSKNIAQCVNGSKSAQTIHFFLTLFLRGNTLKRENRGS